MSTVPAMPRRLRLGEKYTPVDLYIKEGDNISTLKRGTEMKVRVTYSVEDMDFSDVGDDTFDYPNEPNVLSCLKTHFETEQNMDQEGWDHFLMMLETGKWLGGEWTRTGDTFKFQGDVCWYKYQVFEVELEETEDFNRSCLYELAEAIHDNSDGEDMLGIIESYLRLINPEEYKEMLEDYGIDRKTCECDD